MVKKILLLFTFSISSLASAASIEGKWKTVDDKTNQPKSIVEIKRAGNTYVGQIIELLPGATTTVCSKCKGNKKDKPIKGMIVVTGLKKVNETEFEDGKVFDPGNGNTYSASAKLADRGNRLILRGYLGVKLLGRSQTWQRVQ